MATAKRPDYSKWDEAIARQRMSQRVLQATSDLAQAFGVPIEQFSMQPIGETGYYSVPGKGLVYARPDYGFEVYREPQQIETALMNLRNALSREASEKARKTAADTLELERVVRNAKTFNVPVEQWYERHLAGPYYATPAGLAMQERPFWPTETPHLVPASNRPGSFDSHERKLGQMLAEQEFEAMRAKDPFRVSIAQDPRVNEFFGINPVLSALKGNEALARAQGKRFQVDISGLGRLKGYDPLLDKTYDIESGERPPGLRGGGGSYTPEEFTQIQERLARRPSLSALEREAAGRLARAGLGAIRG